MKFRFKRRTSTDVPWVNLYVLDLLWGALAPAVALWLRDPGFFSSERIVDSLLYVGISVTFTSVIFVWFRLSHSVSRFFSVHDAVLVIKASATAVALTTVVCFLLTRLDNIPRSVPLIHFMVLAAGNIAARASRYLRRRRRDRVRFSGAAAENIIIVGVSDLSWFYIQIIEEFGSDLYQVVALLADSRSLQGRFVHGYPVAGRLQDVDQVIEEYEIHGVPIHKLILAEEPTALPAAASELLFEVARKRGISVEILPERLGLAKQPLESLEPKRDPEAELHGLFWRTKRWFDVLVATAVLLLAAPVAAIVALLVLTDCGMPVAFWQVRIGRYGRKVTVYKFRTLKAPYGRGGVMIPPERRVSWIGRLLRLTHLDELPQLLSVIVGDMSLIGPRPLLPVDLAKHHGPRFAIRPGITGWAQINGATLLTPDEKNAMDEWYVRHASWKMDFQIALGTIRSLLAPMRRNEAAIAAALEEERASSHGSAAAGQESAA